jgi:hypothetical protein
MAGSKEAGAKRREQVRTMCGGLVGQPLSEVLALQIERVLRHLLTEEELETISSVDEVAGVFRSKGLIPGCLLKALEGQARPQDLAMCFAVCIYPRRAYAFQQEMPHRLTLFLSLLPSRNVFDFLYRHQLQAVRQDEREQFLRDLSDADCARLESEPAASPIAEERTRGAALFVATCPQEDVDKMLGNWRDDRELVRLIRSFLPTSPSKICEDAGHERLDWEGVREVLMADPRLDGVDPAIRSKLGLAVALERHVWNKVRRSLVPPPPNAFVAQMVAERWEMFWDKLISGYPYYRFSSHFGWWWRRCVGRWLGKVVEQLKRNKEIGDLLEIGDDMDVTLAQDSHSDALGLGELLVFREGYRVVRSTFFRLKNLEQTELQRQVVDDLWYRRIERQLTAEQEPEMVKQIAGKYHDQGITETTVNNLNHRLRLRIWAYTLARQRRWSNQQIFTAELVDEDGVAKRPFRNRTNRAGVLTVACLARTALEDQTLFWPFTAHRVLRPFIDPQHPDVWSFRSYLTEVWCWAAAGSLRPVSDIDCDAHSPMDVEAAKSLKQEPLCTLLSQLSRLRSSEEVQSFERGPGRQLVAEAEFAVRACCRRLVGPSVFSQAHVGGRIKSFRQRAKHWIAPVWYLRVIERLGPQEVIRRLRVEPSDEKTVLQLLLEVTRQ